MHIPARFPSLQKTAATFGIPKDRARELVNLIDEIQSEGGIGRARPAKAKASKKVAAKRKKARKTAKSRTALAKRAPRRRAQGRPASA